MSEQRKLNDISPELKAIIAEALPKKGQTVWFESVRPKSRGTTVLPTDRIYDPGYKEQIDIAYITGYEPAKGPGGVAKDTYGRIQFTRSEFCRMSVTGGNRNEETLFQYLFLTNQNQSNMDKPWYIAGSKAPIFKQDEPSKRASQSIDFDRQVRLAMDSVDRMSSAKLHEIADGLDLDWVKEHTEDDEIIRALYDIAKKNPAKVINLDRDISVRMKADIKEALRLNIINKNDELQIWTWPETGDKICSFQPDKSPIESMVSYFMGSGTKTYQFLTKMIQSEKEGRIQGRAIKKNDKEKEPAKGGVLPPGQD
jgi:hypothetical protein